MAAVATTATTTPVPATIATCDAGFGGLNLGVQIAAQLSAFPRAAASRARAAFVVVGHYFMRPPAAISGGGSLARPRIRFLRNSIAR